MRASKAEFHARSQFGVRPLQFAYFIADDAFSRFNQLAKFVCSQWGGAHNLIIPVPADENIQPAFTDLLRRTVVDRFISYVDPARTKSIENELKTIIPRRNITLLDGAEWEPRDRSAHALWSLAHEKGRHTLRSYDTTSVQDEFEKCALHAIWGGIPDGQQAYFEEHVTLETARVDFDSVDIWKRQADSDPFSSLLCLTSRYLQAHEADDALMARVFDLIVGSSLTGICLYWNLRALRRSTDFSAKAVTTLLVPRGRAQSLNTWIRIADVIRLTPKPIGVTCNTEAFLFCESQADLESTKAAIDGCGEFEEGDGRVSTTIRFGHSTMPGNAEEKGRLVYQCGIPARPNSYTYGALIPTHYQKIPLRRGENEVVYRLPTGLPSPIAGEVVVYMKSAFWDRYAFDDAVAHMIFPHSILYRGALHMPVSSVRDQNELKINILSDFDLASAYFGKRGYSIRTSSCGRFAEALFRRIGGIEGASHLRSTKVIKLMDTLATKSSKKVFQRLREVGLSQDNEQEVLRAFESLDIAPEMRRNLKTAAQLTGITGLKEKQLLEMLAKLSSLNLIRRGLWIECPNCATPTWYALEQLRERIRCTGCEQRFPLPVCWDNGDEIRFQYTLNTLANRVMDQDALANILALATLVPDKSNSCLFIGVELLMADAKSPTAELDFVFTVKGTLWGGECKSNAGFSEKDYETARLAARLGLHRYFFFSLTQPGPQVQKELEHLSEKLKAEGYPMALELVPVTQIFPYDPPLPLADTGSGTLPSSSPPGAPVRSPPPT